MFTHVLYGQTAFKALKKQPGSLVSQALGDLVLRFQPWQGENNANTADTKSKRQKKDSLVCATWNVRRGLILIIRMKETVTEMATGCLRMVKMDIFVLR